MIALQLFAQRELLHAQSEMLHSGWNRRFLSRRREVSFCAIGSTIPIFRSCHVFLVSLERVSTCARAIETIPRDMPSTDREARHHSRAWSDSRCTRWHSLPERIFLRR